MHRKIITLIICFMLILNVMAGDRMTGKSITMRSEIIATHGWPRKASPWQLRLPLIYSNGVYYGAF